MRVESEILSGEVESLAQIPVISRALGLVDELADWVTERHVELTAIAAPTFGEQRRAAYFRGQFDKLGLEAVRQDAAGNVLAEIPGKSSGRQRRLTVLSAHLDTVFPATERIEVHRHNGRIYGPGITDNGAGLSALLALARVLHDSGLRGRHTMLFVANVCEEGEGNLQGMRQLLRDAAIRERVNAMVVLDGANIDHVTAHALGSRRFRVTVEGPGGHSWTDFGTASPIVALAAAIARFSATVVPAQPRTTFNVGEIHGGTSINSIPAAASMKVDIRSASAHEIRRLSAALEKAARQAVEEENQRSHNGRLALRLEEIGERPVAELPEDARILDVVRAVDRYLGIRSRVERSSTDANIPLSLGIEAVSLGGGGQGGGAHSAGEWYDPANRPLGLKRLLLVVCALAGLHRPSRDPAPPRP